MKTNMITSIKNSVVKTISPKKAEKVAEATVKDGERMMAKGQDAAAIQGRAMVKPYEKPEMKEINIKRENTNGSSGNGNGWNTGSEDDFGSGAGTDSNWPSSSSVWDSGW